MGRRKRSDKKIIAAIKGSGGIKSTIAERLDVTWATVHTWVTTVPHLRDVYEDERERVVDMAESVLMRAIQSGNATDAKWYLERRRKDQYSLRREIAIERAEIESMTDDELDAFIDGIS